MKSLISLTTLLPLLAASSPLFSVGTTHNEAAPVISSVNSKEIPDSYIVVFKDHVSHRGAASHHTWIQELHASSESTRAELRKRSQIPFLETTYNGLKHTYNIAGGLLGYSGHFGDDVLEQIRRHPDVSCTGNCRCVLSYLPTDSCASLRLSTSRRTPKSTP